MLLLTLEAEVIGFECLRSYMKRMKISARSGIVAIPETMYLKCTSKRGIFSKATNYVSQEVHYESKSSKSCMVKV
jgi:hypothetical protein